jgi:hypothetical protein
MVHGCAIGFVADAHDRCKDQRFKLSKMLSASHRTSEALVGEV